MDACFGCLDEEDDDQPRGELADQTVVREPEALEAMAETSPQQLRPVIRCGCRGLEQVLLEREAERSMTQKR